MGPSGYWFIDGNDLFSTFAIAIRSGAAGFLQMPERKESITHSWPDQHGIDIDTSKPLFKERDISLTCWLFTEDTVEFWKKHNQFVTQMMKPGLRRITIKAFNGKSYFVIYKAMNGYDQVKKLRLDNGQIVHEFILTLTEPSPQIDYDDTFISADNGEFLIV